MAQYVKGMHDAGIISCLKHFPGHGDTYADTHLGYAVSHKTWEEMLECEMYLKGEGDIVLVLYHVTGERHREVIAQALLAHLGGERLVKVHIGKGIAGVEDAEKEFVSFLSVRGQTEWSRGPAGIRGPGSPRSGSRSERPSG